MKNEVQETLKRKRLTLNEVRLLQLVESKRSVLKELDKKEIELEAQIKVLRFLLSTK